MFAAYLKLGVIAIMFLNLSSNSLRGQTPTEPIASQLDDDQAGEQSIQQAINHLRISANDLNQQIVNLESLWQKSQDRTPDALTSPHAEVWAMDSNGQNARRVGYAPGFPIINSPKISPDGRFVAVDGWRATEGLTAARLLLVNIKSGDVDILGVGAMPNWSPDGQWIAFCKYFNVSGVYVRSLDGETERHIAPNGWGIQWSPDGWKVAYTRGNRFVIHNFVSADSREVVPANWEYTRVYWNPTWSPDSKEVCFKARHKEGHNEFAIINVKNEVPSLRRRISADGFNEAIAWHPDGTRILIPKAAANGEVGQIYSFDPSNEDEPSPFAGQPTDRHNGGMCWSRDGKTLYFISRNAAEAKPDAIEQ